MASGWTYSPAPGFTLPRLSGGTAQFCRVASLNLRRERGDQQISRPCLVLAEVTPVFAAFRLARRFRGVIRHAAERQRHDGSGEGGVRLAVLGPAVEA